MFEFWARISFKENECVVYQHQLKYAIASKQSLRWISIYAYHFTGRRFKVIVCFVPKMLIIYIIIICISIRYIHLNFSFNKHTYYLLKLDFFFLSLCLTHSFDLQSFSVDLLFPSFASPFFSANFSSQYIFFINFVVFFFVLVCFLLLFPTNKRTSQTCEDNKILNTIVFHVLKKK